MGLAIYILSKELFVFEIGVMGSVLFIGCWLYNIIFNKRSDFNEVGIFFASYIILLVLSVVQVLSIRFATLIFFFSFISNSLIKR